MWQLLKSIKSCWLVHVSSFWTRVSFWQPRLGIMCSTGYTNTGWCVQLLMPAAVQFRNHLLLLIRFTIPMVASLNPKSSCFPNSGCQSTIFFRVSHPSTKRAIATGGDAPTSGASRDHLLLQDLVPLMLVKLVESPATMVNHQLWRWNHLLIIIISILSSMATVYIS